MFSRNLLCSNNPESSCIDLVFIHLIDTLFRHIFDETKILQMSHLSLNMIGIILNID